MNELTALTDEEKMSHAGGWSILGPIFIDIIGFVNTFKAGFSDGIRDAIKKP